MSEVKKMLSTLRNDSLKRLHKNILKYEKESVLSDDNILRSLIKKYYGDNDAFFMMNYLAFSREVLFEIAKRHYGEWE